MKKKIASIATATLLSSAFAAQVSANTHVVQKGETLWQLSQKYKVTVNDIKHINNLTSDTLYINQTIQLKVSALAAPPVQNPSSSPDKGQAAQKETNTYTIAAGDTLSKIAAQHKMSLQALMELNGLTTSLIFPGQVLKLTANNGSTAPTPAPPASTPPSTGQLTEYVVKKGDSLSKIALETKTTVANLKSWNNLTSDVIFIGQKLTVTKSSNNSNNNSSNSGGSTTNPTPPAPGNTPELISVAKTLLSSPYVWGGVTPTGFDCSGFIYYVMKQTGSSMGRYSTDGYYARSFYITEPQVGDLVFFANTYRSGISHMGFYLGNNEFIHASSSAGVIISNLNETYYKKHFDGFKRFY